MKINLVEKYPLEKRCDPLLPTDWLVQVNVKRYQPPPVKRPYPPHKAEAQQTLRTAIHQDNVISSRSGEKTNPVDECVTFLNIVRLDRIPVCGGSVETSQT